MEQQWFEFRAYNTQALYGFGTEAEADRYADALNEGREINVYAPYPLTEAEAIELCLDDNTEAFILEDELRARADAV